MRRSLLVFLLALPLGLVAAAGVLAASSGAPALPAVSQPEPPLTSTEPDPLQKLPPAPASRSLGKPWAGRLVRGVQLPKAGRDHFTWDPVLKRVGNRGWRRWGTDRLVALTLRIAHAHRAAYPEAPRVAIGDLSRPRGGGFGPKYGGLGHASHQNGLDVDIYYPRLDGVELRAEAPALVDRELAQDLVGRLARLNMVQYVFTGPSLGLRGPRKKVQELAHHDDHLHVRIRPPRAPE